LPPLLGFTALAILLSILTRNPTVGVAAQVALGFAMQLLSTLGGLNLARRRLLTTPFEAWYGLFTQHRFLRPHQHHSPSVVGLVRHCLDACASLGRCLRHSRQVSHTTNASKIVRRMSQAVGREGDAVELDTR